MGLAREAHAKESTKSLFVSTGEFLIHIHASQLAERILSQELLLGTSVDPFLLLSQLEIQRRNFAAAEEYLSSALALHHNNPYIWSALGHLQYIQKSWAEARMSYETVFSFATGNY